MYCKYVYHGLDVYAGPPSVVPVAIRKTYSKSIIPAWTLTHNLFIYLCCLPNVLRSLWLEDFNTMEMNLKILCLL